MDNRCDSGFASFSGLGGLARAIALYYQYASSEYGAPTDGTWTHITDTLTTSGGHYEYEWDPEDSLDNGFYCIKAEFEGDEDYLPCFAKTGIDLANLHIVPESWGTIAGVVAPLLALLFVTIKKGNVLGKIL